MQNICIYQKLLDVGYIPTHDQEGFGWIGAQLELDKLHQQAKMYDIQETESTTKAKGILLEATVNTNF